MNLFKQTYHRFSSLLLLSAFLLPLTLQEAHVLLEHHEVKDRCVASQEGDQHLHDSEEIDFHCFLCCNKLTEYFEDLRLESPAPLVAEKQPVTGTSTDFILTRLTHTVSQRGPPRQV